MLLRNVIRNNVNGDHVLFRAGDLKMTVIRCWDLIRCGFPAAADPVVKGAYCDIILATPVGIVRGKVILQSQGKEFFTWHGKDFFT